MDSAFWHERWKQKQIGFHQQEINSHLQAYWSRLELPVGGRIFVPLCGKSLDMLWLRSQGHEVLGIEISPIAVEEFFQENGLTPRVERGERFESWQADGIELLVGDFFDLESDDLRGCVGVYDRASLVAMPPQMRSAYAEKMGEILPTDAELLLVTTEYLQQEMSGPPFSVQESEVSAIYGAAFNISVMAEIDIWAENPVFQNKGLSQLVEKVYRINAC